DFTVQAVGGAPQQVATQQFRLDVSAGLIITTAETLPDGTTFAAYTAALNAAGGVGPYSWSLTAGALPEGLALSNSGSISGTPTRVGSATITVEAADNSNSKATKSFTISIVAPALGTLSLTNVADTMNPAQQLVIGLSLSAPPPKSVSGSLKITFTSNS